MLCVIVLALWQAIKIRSLFLPLSCPVLLSLGVTLYVLARRAETQANQLHIDSSIKSVYSNQALSSKATNNTTIAWYSTARF